MQPEAVAGMPGDQPVEALQRLVPELVGRLPALLDEVCDLLSERWSEHARMLAHSRTEVLEAAEEAISGLAVTAAQTALGAPVAMPAHPAPQHVLFEAVGAAEWQDGRDLTSLLSAYQVGARAAWRQVADVARHVPVSQDLLTSMAEALFVFVDQISSASARGYLAEQSRAVASRERARDELTELLLADNVAPLRLRAAATRAGWPLPRDVALVLVEHDHPDDAELFSRLDSACLPVRRPGLTGAVVPDAAAPGRRRRLEMLLQGVGASVGPSVDVEHLALTVGIVEVAARLRREGVLLDDPLFVDDHLDAIIVHRDGPLLARLRRRCLAPLDDSRPAVRERLEETLASWLRHAGDRRAVAAELGVHPQTVRYRMSQLEELFGPALADPGTRTRLTLALAWDAPSATGRATRSNPASTLSVSRKPAGETAGPAKRGLRTVESADSAEARIGRGDRTPRAHRPAREA